MVTALGVDLGQGYLLGQPALEPHGAPIDGVAWVLDAERGSRHAPSLDASVARPVMRRIAPSD